MSVQDELYEQSLNTKPIPTLESKGVIGDALQQYPASVSRLFVRTEFNIACSKFRGRKIELLLDDEQCLNTTPTATLYHKGAIGDPLQQYTAALLRTGETSSHREVR